MFYGLHLLLLSCCALAPIALCLVLARDIRGGLLSRVIGVVVCWLLLEVLVVVTVGLSGALSVPRLMCCEVVLGCGGMVALRRLGGSDLLQELSSELTSWRTASWTEQCALIAIAFVGGMALVAMIAIPSADYDTWMYQLPQVAEWIQKQSLGAYQDQWSSTPTFARLILYYPGNWTSLFWLFTAPMANDEFTLLPTLVGWALLGLSSAGLVRAGSGSRGSALLAAALVMTLPLAGSNLHSAHIDLGQGSLLLALIYLSINALGQGCGRSLLLALALGGMLVGTKMSGIPQLAAPVLVGVLLWRGRAQLQGFSAGLAVLAALSCAAGISWYVRNYLHSGNPLGYVAVPSLGWTGGVDHAYIARTSLLHCFHVRNLHHWFLVMGALLYGGGGLTLLALLLIPYRLVRRAGAIEWTLVLVAGMLAAQYIAGPWSAKPALDDDLSWWLMQQLRYTWAIWGLLAAATALALERVHWPAVIPTVLVIVSALYAPFTTAGWEAALLGGACAAGLCAWLLRGHVLALGHAGVLIGCLGGIGALAACESLRWRILDQRGYGVPEYLERTLRGDETIAFWGSHQSWLLYGRHLEHRVHYLYLPVIEPGVAQDSSIDSTQAMWRELCTTGIRYLALGPKWHEFPGITYSRIESHPEWFELVHGDPAVWGMCIYRVRLAPSHPSGGSPP